VPTSWHFPSKERILSASVPFCGSTRAQTFVSSCRVRATRFKKGLAAHLQSVGMANVMHIQAGNHAVADHDHAFRAFRDGEGERHFDYIVKFEQPFEEVPQILVTLTRIDIAPHTALRLCIAAEKISASGFTLRYSTWANSQILGVGARWMAFHAALSDLTLTGRIL
jgi:hypothetical protein